MAVSAARKTSPAPSKASGAVPAPRRAKAARRCKATLPLQAKLKINEPNDRFEREADAVADRVMQMPEPETKHRHADGCSICRKRREEDLQTFSLQRLADEEEEAQAASLQRREDEEGEAQTASLQRQEDEEEEAQAASLQRQEDEEEEAQTASLQRQEDEEEEAQTASLQRQEDEEEEAQTASLQRREQEEDEEMQPKAAARGRARATPAFESRLRALKASGGRPLDAPVRTFMEGRFRRSFENVRVHTGPAAAILARRANARAFTVGRHLVFGNGEYRPNADQGRRLIAHELTHVIQQRGGLHGVQRELFASETQTRQQSDERVLLDIRRLMGFKDGSFPAAITSIVTELLRIAVTGPQGHLLNALTAGEFDAVLTSRLIQTSDYDLYVSVTRAAASAAVEWTLTRAGEKRPLFGHARTVADDSGAGSSGVDERTLTVATPTPPRYRFDPAVGDATSTPSDLTELPASEPVRTPQTVSPPSGDALETTDASPQVDTAETSDAGRGDSAGTDAPSVPRPPIDVQADDGVPEEEQAPELEVSRKPGCSVPTHAGVATERAVARVVAAPGLTLPTRLRSDMESRFDADFSSVRVHQGDDAAIAAMSLGAQAFTVGPHLVFGRGYFEPGSEPGRELLAHELAHVIQQRSGRSPGNLIQRQAEECPPPDPVPEVGVVASPTSPAEDPAFSQMERRTENRAANQGAHGSGADKSAEANSAAEVREGENRTHAQSEQVGEMATQAANPPTFNKKAFVSSLLAEVEKIAPETLDDVVKFAGRGKAGQVKTAVQGEVATASQNTQGPLEESATADPGPGQSPRMVTPLNVESPGAQPGSVRADRAMPPPRTESEMDLRADTVRADNMLKEACITREYMDEHGDPELAGAAAAQDDLHTVAEEGPQRFREGESAELENARAGASAEGARGVAGMFGARTGNFGEVGTAQAQTKTDNERKREAAANEVNTIFTDTQSKVQDRLTQLDTDVSDTFDRETDAAVNKFESFIRFNAEKYEKSWFDSAVEFFSDILFDPPPREVRDFYREGRVTFLRDMEVVISNVADIVQKGIEDARKIVDEGKQKVQEKLDALGSDLGDFKQQISDQMNDRFRQLERDIDAKQGEIVKNLAQRYVQAFERVKAIENQVREEYKNAFDRAREAIEGAVEFVTGWVEKLTAVVGGAATRIIREPGKFLRNVGAGIIQGFTMFMDEIGTNIKGAVVQWITGNMAGGGIQLPQTFDVKGIVGFLLDLVGLGVSGIKQIARQVFGARAVGMIERGVAGFEKIKAIFDILASEGPAGLVKFLQTEFTRMKEAIMEGAAKALSEGLVIAGIKKVLGIISGLVSGGVGTVVTIVLTIIDVILWIRDNAAQIAEVVSTIASMAMAVLQGQVAALAGAINTVLKRLLPLVLGFVGALVGINRVVRKIQKIFKAIGRPARRAIRKLFLKFKKLIKKLLRRFGKKKRKGKRLDSRKVVRLVLQEMKRPTKAKTPGAAIAEKTAQAQALKSKYQPKLEKGRLSIEILDRNPSAVEKDADIDFVVSASPGKKGAAPVPIEVEDRNAVQKRFAKARTLKKFAGDSGFTVADWGGTFSSLSAATHAKDLQFGVSNGVLEKRSGKFHFKSDVSRKEIVQLGAAEVQNAGRAHAPFQNGRFGVPLIQAFLSVRRIAGVPPDSYNDRGIVSDVATRADRARAIKKVGRTNTWALPTIPPRRNLPSGWGGASHVRPKLYEKGAGFPTLADKLHAKVVASKIRPLVDQQIDNHDAARAAGTIADMAPWQSMIGNEFAKASEKFSITKARKGAYFERGRYDVDHVRPLAQHWNATGNDSGQSERIAATKGERGGLQLLERGVNRAKGSEGVNYQPWVGTNFTSPGGDQFHIVPGVLFKDFE
jgi:hypothetical protein